MTERALAGLDLNLLVTLDALLAERSVTRAARRLGLSQPAVSVQLGKLRHALGDPLLLPRSRGVSPTSLAASLEAPLREALEQLVGVIAPARSFEAATAETTFRLAASDYSERAIVQPLLAVLRKEAPRSRVSVVEASPPTLGPRAERAEMDLAFVRRDAAPAGLRVKSLFHERYLLAGRTDHPALRRRPTLATLSRLEFALVSPDGGGFRSPVDEALEARGVERRVVLSVPHFLFLLSAISGSDLVAFVPARLVQGAPGIRAVEPPLEVPGFEMTMVWPERVHRDAAQMWLRARVVASAGGRLEG